MNGERSHRGNILKSCRVNHFENPPYDSVSLISGFHHALLQSVTFIGRLNALDYTKLRS